VMQELYLTKKEREIIYETLIKHDGQTLRPDLPRDEQRVVSLALDRMRLWLLSPESISII